jgi:hypothetical protein
MMIDQHSDWKQIQVMFGIIFFFFLSQGHFSELHRVFSRIRNHEVIRSRGERPVDVAKREYLGNFAYPLPLRSCFTSV